jgi:hypothetical protein
MKMFRAFLQRLGLVGFGSITGMVLQVEIDKGSVGGILATSTLLLAVFVLLWFDTKLDVSLIKREILWRDQIIEKQDTKIEEQYNRISELSKKKQLDP